MHLLGTWVVFTLRTTVHTFEQRVPHSPPEHEAKRLVRGGHPGGVATELFVTNVVRNIYVPLADSNVP